ncbi:zinc finger MYND domain-containing protein 15 isoform X4 [Pipistrellus kuhlii]|uniref:zinc finger MYND domain-containing protein 15 isoform X4 n=1 Tax=Pipistrellus kuhlii TaxID=59472 RepID=UPI001E2702F7|nr:zinc finger MYND domain-containing protein 15 isoform X4 [Pipistrellus kuhlii]
MEFVSGYRDEFLDFTALLFGWFRKFVAERGAVETSLVGHWRQLEAQIRRLPQDPALWVLHVLPNRSVGISLGQGAEPGPGPGLGAGWLLGDQPPLHLRDLSPYVSFVSLEEGEEGEEEEEEEEEEENGEEEGAGTEKVEPEEDGEPVHTSRESPQEANLPGQPEEAEQKEGGGENGYHEERAEDEAGSKRRKGRRSEAAPLHLACLLLVTDEHGTILGIDLLMGGAQRSAGKGSWTENLAPRAYALLCHSMACPMGSGDPRKPRQLTVGDAQLHRDLEMLVPRLGVKLAKTPMRTWGPQPGFTFASLRARTCHVCHKHSFEVKLTPCPQCSAVLYCGEACLRADWRRCPDDVSHRFWCPRLAAFMERTGELATLPFTYTAEVTSETFNKEAFLASRGLTRGYWTQISMLIPGRGTPRHPRGSTPSPSLLLHGDPYQLLQGDGPVLMPPVPADPPRGLFGSWRDYYTWRGLSLDSPMAVLLTYPLTVYYVITHLVPQSFPELNIQNKQSLKIHVVEAGKEFDLVMVFWDGPEVSVRPGSGVSARLSSGTKEKGGRRDLQIKVSARPYHLLQGPKPDLVIGFNSGFGLKDTWLSSLPRLQVGTGANGDFPHLLPSPCSLPDDDVCFSSIRSAALGAASGPSLCPPRTAPPSPPFWVLRVLPSALPLLLGRSWGQEPPCKSEARLPPTPVPPSARLLHGEQRVRLCDGRADHGRGRRRGHQPPAAQPLPLPVSSPSGRQLHALVLQRLHLPPDLQALAGQRGPRGAGARTPSPDPRRARRPRPEAPRGEEAGARAPPAEVRAGGSGPRLPPPPQASERDIKPVRPRGRPRGRARKR